MSKVVSIVGPTAVGKTMFAFTVAETLLAQGMVTGVDIISADSRQVYKGLEIVSGADVPVEYVQQERADWPKYKLYFEHGPIRLFGIGLLSPDEEWSVSQFQSYAQQVINVSITENRLVIIVGGTGLYQQHIFTADPQLHVPPNFLVRERAESMSVPELQAWLAEVDEQRLSHMNQSDSLNPRRLVRAIEIGLFNELKDEAHEVQPGTELLHSQLVIGLTDDITAIVARIERRVDERLEQGALNEVERLLAHYPNQKLPVFSATGVKPLLGLATGQLSPPECQKAWLIQERQYAKRQLTWWKKQTDVTWFTVAESDWQAKALEQIVTWYKS